MSDYISGAIAALKAIAQFINDAKSAPAKVIVISSHVDTITRLLEQRKSEGKLKHFNDSQMNETFTKRLQKMEAEIGEVVKMEKAGHKGFWYRIGSAVKSAFSSDYLEHWTTELLEMHALLKSLGDIDLELHIDSRTNHFTDESLAKARDSDKYLAEMQRIRQTIAVAPDDPQKLFEHGMALMLRAEEGFMERIAKGGARSAAAAGAAPHTAAAAAAAVNSAADAMSAVQARLPTHPTHPPDANAADSKAPPVPVPIGNVYIGHTAKPRGGGSKFYDCTLFVSNDEKAHGGDVASHPDGFQSVRVILHSTFRNRFYSFRRGEPWSLSFSAYEGFWVRVLFVTNDDRILGVPYALTLPVKDQSVTHRVVKYVEGTDALSSTLACRTEVSGIWLGVVTGTRDDEFNELDTALSDITAANNKRATKTDLERYRDVFKQLSAFTA